MYKRQVSGVVVAGTTVDSMSSPLSSELLTQPVSSIRLQTLATVSFKVNFIVLGPSRVHFKAFIKLTHGERYLILP